MDGSSVGCHMIGYLPNVGRWIGWLFMLSGWSVGWLVGYVLVDDCWLVAWLGAWLHCCWLQGLVVR